MQQQLAPALDCGGLIGHGAAGDGWHARQAAARSTRPRLLLLPSAGRAQGQTAAPNGSGGRPLFPPIVQYSRTWQSLSAALDLLCSCARFCTGLPHSRVMSVACPCYVFAPQDHQLQAWEQAVGGRRDAAQAPVPRCLPCTRAHFLSTYITESAALCFECRINAAFCFCAVLNASHRAPMPDLEMGKGVPPPVARVPKKRRRGQYRLPITVALVSGLRCSPF